MTDEKISEGTGEPMEAIEVKPGETGELVVDDPSLPEAPAIENAGPGKVIASYGVRVVVRALADDNDGAILTVSDLSRVVGEAIARELGNDHVTVRAERLDR